MNAVKTYAMALALALGIGFSLPAEVGAQSADTQALLDRIARLERDIQVMQRQIYRGEVSGVPASAPQAAPADGETPMPADGMAGGEGGGSLSERLLVRMSDLERLVTELTGRVERAQFEANQAKDQMERMARDYEFRFSQIEQRLSGAPAPQAVGTTPGMAPGMAPGMPQPMGGPMVPPTGITPVGPGAQPTQDQQQQPATTPAPMTATRPAPATVSEQMVVLPEGPEKDQYAYARGFLAKMDYAAAEKAFKLYLDAHPQGEFAGNAMYWLGETFYVREDYAQAASTFIEGYQKYPLSSKAPDNLLKLGLSLGRSGKTDDACTAFKLLDSKFPDALEVLKRRAAAEKEKLGCK